MSGTTSLAAGICLVTVCIYEYVYIIIFKGKNTTKINQDNNGTQLLLAPVGVPECQRQCGILIYFYLFG